LNSGTWTGFGSGSSGAIISTSAAGSPARFSIGYADSGDGTGVNTNPNTVELKFTLAADASNFGNPQVSWDKSASETNYDGQVSLADFGILTSTFGQPLPTIAAAGSPRRGYACG